MRNTPIFQALSLFCSSLLLAGCLGESPDNSGPYAPIPDVQLFCSTVVPGCEMAQEGKKIFVGLLKADGSSYSCQDDLIQQSLLPPLSQHFDASAEAPSEVRGPGLYGVFFNWRGSLGQIVSSLERGSYHLCAFLDLNDNGRYDLGEPYAEDPLEIGQDLMPYITNWTHF